MTNEPQALSSNSSRLEVIPLQAVGDFFQAWNGNSWMLGAFRESSAS